jgi:hypothetical protein
MVFQTNREVFRLLLFFVLYSGILNNPNELEFHLLPEFDSSGPNHPQNGEEQSEEGLMDCFQ